MSTSGLSGGFLGLLEIAPVGGGVTQAETDQAGKNLTHDDRFDGLFERRSNSAPASANNQLVSARLGWRVAFWRVFPEGQKGCANHL